MYVAYAMLLMLKTVEDVAGQSTLPLAKNFMNDVTKVYGEV